MYTVYTIPIAYIKYFKLHIFNIKMQRPEGVDVWANKDHDSQGVGERSNEVSYIMIMIFKLYVSPREDQRLGCRDAK